MKILNFKELPSTNEKAKALARKKIAPWLILVAEEQTAGYGKEKVFWFSPRGGLYFSIILPKSKIEDLQTLTILTAFIVAKTIKNNFSLESLIKLPNDVLINGRKVCGILTENVIGASTSSAPTLRTFDRAQSRAKVERVGKEVKSSVIGIGLNTNIDKFPKELENIATSLKIELGEEVNNEKILKQIVKGLKEQLKTISE